MIPRRASTASKVFPDMGGVIYPQAEYLRNLADSFDDPLPANNLRTAATHIDTLHRSLDDANKRLSETTARLERMQKTVSPDENTRRELLEYLEANAEFGRPNERDKCSRAAKWVRDVRTADSVYAYAIALQEAAKSAMHAIGKALYSGIDRRDLDHAHGLLVTALAKSEGAARADDPARAREVHSATSSPAGDEKALGDRASPVPDLIQDDARTVQLRERLWNVMEKYGDKDPETADTACDAMAALENSSFNDERKAP